jgi:hypothetical protein
MGGRFRIWLVTIGIRALSVVARGGPCRTATAGCAVPGDAPGRQQSQLVLGRAADIGGVGDEGETVPDELEGVTGQLKVADDLIVQPLTSSVVQPHILPGPPGGERLTAGGQLTDKVAQGTVTGAAPGRDP